jgi:hypothetical protein
LAEEKQEGKQLAKPQLETRKDIRLFRNFIDLIVFKFHNFPAFASLFVVWNQ